MTEQWRELKETITEMRDNGGTGTQQDVCKFLVNLMKTLEKQMQEPCDDCTVIKKLSKKYYVEDAYGYTDEGIVNKVNEIIDAVNESSSTPQRQKGKWIKIPITLCHYPCDGCAKDKGRADDEWCSSCEFWKAEDFNYKCSECGKIYSEIENYCPNCGTEMETE